MSMDQQSLDAALRSDFESFVSKVFTHLNPGAPFRDNWHIQLLANRLERARHGDIKRLIVNIPPRSLKSTICSVAWPAFILGHNPSAAIIGVSYSQQLASDLSRNFIRVITSDWYGRIFPECRFTKMTEDLVETSKGGKRRATSTEGSITGLGAGLIIVDDPMSTSAATSEAEREKVTRFYQQSLFSRLNDKVNGTIVILHQRLHEDDLSGHLLSSNPGGWTHINLPAIATQDELIDIDGRRTHQRRVGDVLHPEHEPMSALDEAKRTMGSLQFEAQYQQAPVPDKGNLVQRDWFKLVDSAPDRSAGQIIQSWDTAYKDDPSCDYSVCTTWLRSKSNHYLIDVYRERRNFPDLLRDAKALYAKHRPDCVLIEEQGTGITMIQALKELSHSGIIARKSKDDKKTRLVSVLPTIEAGDVCLPRHAPWLAEFLGELCGFPARRHDDQVDSVSQYLLWVRDQVPGLISFNFWLDEPHEQGVPDAESILSMRPPFGWR